MTTSIIALEKDLFFSVKIRDTLRHHAMEATIARTLAAFEQGLNATPAPTLAIVDIATIGVDWEAAIRAARARQLPVLAFGSHMDLEARTRALKAGAHKVVANSKFSTDMPGLINRLRDTVTKQGVSNAVEDEEDSEFD
ncbi:hypothetical protein [Dictyobacter kobayashii]|uniref:Response regulatory domain-containing protein n=1 Tax=Dictyobacter kobayashii TaxID=2014872 RepID=A0A402ADK3_9CHLR|nr:hypothetical protein [Dictyobacter kobayashii]GCE17171.1 hypothetical protein KDK_09710 [Dictyobacter kobayashii]